MSINVYWASVNDNWILAKEPDSMLLNFNTNYGEIKFNPNSQLLRCPAVKDYCNNLYCLRSLQDYEFRIEENKDDPNNSLVLSDQLDQDFFQERVIIRSLESKMFSFKANTYLFFTEEKSLEVTYPIHPYLEDNNVSLRIMPITGTFDIAKWFRPLDFGFFIRKEFDTFKIQKDEVFAYIKFHTNEKINFKQFVITPELTNFTKDCTILTKYSPLKSLENYYKLFKTKKLILKEIKRNLVK
jgi:hypothetical protein